MSFVAISFVSSGCKESNFYSLPFGQAEASNCIVLAQMSFQLAPKIFWWAELILQFFGKMNSWKYFTYPLGKLRYLHRQIFNILFCPQNLSTVSSDDVICISGVLFWIYLPKRDQITKQQIALYRAYFSELCLGQTQDCCFLRPCLCCISFFPQTVVVFVKFEFFSFHATPRG